MRILSLLLLFGLVACAPATSRTPEDSAIPSTLPVRHLPPPSEHPRYPPVDLGDVVALADQGAERRWAGAEGQRLSRCSRGWERIQEPAGMPPRQIAADLLKVAIDRHILLTSCGGFIFGTMDLTPCNCYHGDHGYLEIDRGPEAAPEPGKMLIYFAADENKVSPGDWQITVDQADL
jgi:hypothetical protein